MILFPLPRSGSLTPMLTFLMNMTEMTISSATTTQNWRSDNPRMHFPCVDSDGNFFRVQLNKNQNKFKKKKKEEERQMSVSVVH